MQMSRFIYIARRWAVDERRMADQIDHLTRDRDRGFQIVLFPEGELKYLSETKGPKSAENSPASI